MKGLGYREKKIIGEVTVECQMAGTVYQPYFELTFDGDFALGGIPEIHLVGINSTEAKAFYKEICVLLEQNRLKEVFEFATKYAACLKQAKSEVDEVVARTQAMVVTTKTELLGSLRYVLEEPLGDPDVSVQYDEVLGSYRIELKIGNFTPERVEIGYNRENVSAALAYTKKLQKQGKLNPKEIIQAVVRFVANRFEEPENVNL